MLTSLGNWFSNAWDWTERGSIHRETWLKILLTGLLLGSIGLAAVGIIFIIALFIYIPWTVVLLVPVAVGIAYSIVISDRGFRN